MKKAYLAAPFFTEKEKEIYKKIIEYLRDGGEFDLYVPQEHEIEGGWNMDNFKWGFQVFQADRRAIDESEIVFVVNYGMYSDSGTAWECGYAYAKGKTVVQFLVNDTKEFSLMMMNGAHSSSVITHSIDLDYATETLQTIIVK